MWFTIYNLEYNGLSLYIGITKNIQRRIKDHKTRKDGSNSKNIPKYIDWDFEILEIINVLDNKLAWERELYWIKKLSPIFNQRDGTYWIK